MYARQPTPPKQSIKIPENYSGHAFSNAISYNDMPPPIRRGMPEYDLPPEDTEALSAVPSEDISDAFVSEKDREEEAASTEDSAARKRVHTERREESAPLPVTAVPKKENERASLFSSLMPPGGSLANHFPFGHGIGSEELLILAIMLMVFLSGSEDEKSDTDFMLLLGLLLFAG